MMRARMKRLSPGELYSAPELAVLDIIEVALDVMRVAVVAAHAERRDRDDDEDDPERRAGRGLIHAAHDFAAAARRYRLALAEARERRRDELLPF